jgi:hypothetical protein
MTEEEIAFLAKYGLSPDDLGATTAVEPEAPVADTAEADDDAFMKRYGLTAADLSPPPAPTTPEREYAEPTLGNQALHVLKGFGRNVMDTVEMPYNMDKIGGLVSEKTALPGYKDANPELFNPRSYVDPEGYDQFSETIGGEVVDPEQAPFADRLRTIAEWAGPGGLTRAALTKVQKSLGDMAPEVFNPNRQVGRDVAGDLAVGTAAAGGEQIASTDLVQEKLRTDPFWGEMIGGGSGEIGRLLLGRAPRPNEAAISNMIEVGGQTPEDANRVRAALLRGEQGTTADLSGNQRTFDLQAGLEGGDRTGEFRRSVDEAAVTRQGQIRGDINRQLGTGTPENVGPTVEADIARQSQEVMDAATETAEGRAPAGHGRSRADRNRADRPAPGCHRTGGQRGRVRRGGGTGRQAGFRRGRRRGPQRHPDLRSGADDARVRR